MSWTHSRFCHVGLVLRAIPRQPAVLVQLRACSYSLTGREMTPPKFGFANI